MKTFNRKILKDKRKRLRNNLTQAEAFLWGYLKNSQFEGRKFRRQSSIKSFIVDFYCPEEKLIIELDGDFHFDEKAMKDDEKRSKILEEEGLKIIRFENQEVLLNLENVLKRIKGHFRKNKNSKIIFLNWLLNNFPKTTADPEINSGWHNSNLLQNR